MYDASGNLTSAAGLSASYNAAGQTAQVTPTGGASSAFAYAGASQNQLTTAGSTAISPSGLGIAQTTQTTGTTATTTGYAYTPQGSLLAQHTSSGTSYYLLGRLGSVLGLTNASGSLVDHYTYTPYGQQTVLAQAVPNLFGYDGGLMVQDTPLIHFGVRYYDPALGTWTQLDPSGQSPAYVFAGANPVNYTDLSGTSWTGVIIGSAVGGFVGGVVAGSLTFTGAAYVGAAAGGCVGGAIGNALTTGSPLAGCAEGAAGGVLTQGATALGAAVTSFLNS